MPGVTGSGSGHTIGVETGHTGATVVETGHTCAFLMNTLSMVLRRFPSPFRRHPLHNTATRATPGFYATRENPSAYAPDVAAAKCLHT